MTCHFISLRLQMTSRLSDEPFIQLSLSYIEDVSVAVQDMHERISTDMTAAAASIQHSTVLTIHGTADRTIPMADAEMFAEHIKLHKLKLVDGADHRFTQHADRVIQLAVDFMLEPQAM